jgi:hypothetical protein
MFGCHNGNNADNFEIGGGVTMDIITIQEGIDFLGGIVLFFCAATIYCLLSAIYLGLSVAWLGVTLGVIDIIVYLSFFIASVISRQRELDEIEANKTWIDRVLEKGI